jgi:hypothetical protein
MAVTEEIQIRAFEWHLFPGKGNIKFVKGKKAKAILVTGSEGP